MYRVAIKLTFFLCLINTCVAFSQNASNNKALAANYNKWLKSLQLNKFIIADRVETSGAPDSYTLYLKPADIYRVPADLAKAWGYFKDGFQEKGVDLPLLLFNKFSEYADLPLNKVKVVLQSTNPEVFSLKIFCDKEVVVQENIASVRGGDVTVDYNFDAPPLISILSHTYNLKSSIPDLKAYAEQWQTFFLTYKHKPNEKIQIEIPHLENGALKFIVGNIYKDVTGENYYEKLVLEIVTTHPRNQPPQIDYSASVFYAATSGNKAPPLAAYKDIADEPDFAQNLSNYKSKFEKQFQAIFHVGP